MSNITIENIDDGSMLELTMQPPFTGSFDGSIIPASAFDAENTVKDYIDGIAAGIEGEIEESVEEWMTDTADASIGDWLEDHPEATTTVQDGSITDAKLVQTGGVLSRVNEICYEDLQSVSGSFNMTAGSSHSALDDRLSFPCKSGETILVQVTTETGEVYTSFPLYGSSDTISNHSIKSGITSSGKWYSVTLSEDLDSFGIYIGAKLTNNTVYWKIRKIASVYFNFDTDTVFTTNSSAYFEPVGNNGGMYVYLGAKLYLRGMIEKTTNWSDFLPNGKTTSPSGFASCVFVPHNNSIVYNLASGDYEIIETALIDHSKYVPIIIVATRASTEAVVGGIGLHLYLIYLSEQKSQVTTTAKAEEYATLLNDSAETEQFIYFADPHLMGSANDVVNFQQNFKNYMDEIYAYADSAPVTFAMCGGDWRNKSDNPSIAKYKLGLIYGACEKFKRFYGVVGNHDTNYQGVDDLGNANSGILDNQTIANAMFGGEHSNYYSFKGVNTRFYVFDSGTNTSNAMNAYRWEQIAWFANSLIEDDAPHSAVSIHIWYTNYNDPTDDTISPLAENITSIINAYNSRSTVSMNDIVYDFSDCSGQMEFIICGHTHFDKTGTFAGIPAINTLNTQNGGIPSFDFVYVDYDNRAINTVRVGTGSNRTFELGSLS